MARSTKIAILAALAAGALLIAFRLGMRHEYDQVVKVSSLPPAVSVKQGEPVKVLPNLPRPSIVN